MKEGEKCICQFGEWHNAFGDQDFSLSGGMRLTVSGSINVAGTRFYSFKEAPERNYYMALGFKPMRELN